MCTILKKSAYESLIGQIVFIEENSQYIQSVISQNAILPRGLKAQAFFTNYIKRIEALAKDIQIVNDSEIVVPGSPVNRLPFIVLGSYFTLKEPGKSNTYCHICVQNDMRKDIYNEIFFLSETGMQFLLQETGADIWADIGFGRRQYTISSIRFI